MIGEKPVIKKHSNHVTHVSLGEPGVCTDVDYPTIYSNHQKTQKIHKNYTTPKQKLH